MKIYRKIEQETVFLLQFLVFFFCPLRYTGPVGPSPLPLLLYVCRRLRYNAYGSDIIIYNKHYCRVYTYWTVERSGAYTTRTNEENKKKTKIEKRISNRKYNVGYLLYGSVCGQGKSSMIVLCRKRTLISVRYYYPVVVYNLETVAVNLYFKGRRPVRNSEEEAEQQGFIIGRKNYRDLFACVFFFPL